MNIHHFRTAGLAALLGAATASAAQAKNLTETETPLSEIVPTTAATNDSEAQGYAATGGAYETKPGSSRLAEELRAIRLDWYTQFGLDMTLQHPYGSPEGSTFTEGRTQGIVVAAGRWFTPGVGLRFRTNWENGFPPLSNKKATWLNFVDTTQPNAEHGGYLTVVGDIQFDLLGLFGPDRPDRRWRLEVFPRAGVAYNFGLKKGAPILGVGGGLGYRLNDRCSLFAEAAYESVASGFNGRSTDVGTGANGYVDFLVGVQLDLGHQSRDEGHGFTRAGRPRRLASWTEGWFVEAGLDMTNHLPYGVPKDHAFAKGRTHGVAVGLGKRFSPEIAIRARVDWENGLPFLGNNKLEWVAPVDEATLLSTNEDGGGCLFPYADVLVSLPALFANRDAERRWDVLFIPRMGLGINVATGSWSPLLGLGLGASYRVAPRVDLYADYVYEAITTDFVLGEEGKHNGVPGAGTGMLVPAGHNKMLPLNVGVRIRLGK